MGILGSPLRARAHLGGMLVAGALATHGAPASAQFDARSVAVERQSAPVERDSAAHGGTRDGARWLLSLEAVTNAPVDMGARVTLEAPFRARLSLGAGVVPRPYLKAVNRIVAAAGAYQERTADIVDGSFDDGSTWRAQVGFRPFAGYGFYIDGGYSRVRLSGNVYVADVAPSLGDLVIAGVSVRDAGYRVTMTMHLWLVEIGWQARVFDRLVLGAGLGVMGTVSARTRAEPDFEQGRSAVARALSRRATQTIDDAIETYGYLPTLTVRLGFGLL